MMSTGTARDIEAKPATTWPIRLRPLVARGPVCAATGPFAYVMERSTVVVSWMAVFEFRVPVTVMMKFPVGVGEVDEFIPRQAPRSNKPRSRRPTTAIRVAMTSRGRATLGRSHGLPSMRSTNISTNETATRRGRDRGGIRRTQRQREAD